MFITLSILQNILEEHTSDECVFKNMLCFDRGQLVQYSMGRNVAINCNLTGPGSRFNTVLGILNKLWVESQLRLL